MLKCLVNPRCFGWDEVVKEGVKAWKGKKLHSNVCELALGATVYNIWKHPNNIKFCTRVNSERKRDVLVILDVIPMSLLCPSKTDVAFKITI
jgi:hypothetical protein